MFADLDTTQIATEYGLAEVAHEQAILAALRDECTELGGTPKRSRKDFAMLEAEHEQFMQAVRDFAAPSPGALSEVVFVGEFQRGPKVKQSTLSDYFKPETVNYNKRPIDLPAAIEETNDKLAVFTSSEEWKNRPRFSALRSCFGHSKTGHGIISNAALEVRHSTIPGAGLGLFATEDIPTGHLLNTDIIQFYEGDEEQVDHLSYHNSGPEMIIKPGKLVMRFIEFIICYHMPYRIHTYLSRAPSQTGKAKKSTLGHHTGVYANGATFHFPGNATFSTRFQVLPTNYSQHVTAMMLLAARDIKAGEEIFVFYH